MELECEKYHDKMDSEKAVCRHPGDYCQHRQACMIHFIEKDNKRNGGTSLSPGENKEQE